jgi:hypothetical protein
MRYTNCKLDFKIPESEYEMQIQKVKKIEAISSHGKVNLPFWLDRSLLLGS